MKFAIIFSALSTLFSFAYAQTCQVNLIDNNRVIRGFQARLDVNGRCRDAMRECSKFKRTNNHPYGQCEEVDYNQGGGHTGGGNNGGGHTGGGHTGGGHQNADFRTGDTVFPTTWNSSLGARVLSVNTRRDELRVQSRTSGSVYTFRFSEVAVSRGCLEANLCVGDNVLIGSWNSALGADIIGINLYTNKLLVKSRTSGSTYLYSTADIYVKQGCLYSYCVGQRVYPRTWNSSIGGQIIGLSRTQRSYIVKSNTSGSIYVMRSNDF